MLAEYLHLMAEDFTQMQSLTRRSAQTANAHTSVPTLCALSHPRSVSLDFTIAPVMAEDRHL